MIFPPPRLVVYFLTRLWAAERRSLFANGPLPGFISILCFNIHQFTKGNNHDGQEKGVKELNGKEGVLSADPSPCIENGKKK
jgi:hypothetical protein